MKGLPAVSNSDVTRAYARWAPYYDAAFALVMRAGRQAAAAAASRIGGRILDLGVGTGLELPLFEPRLRVVGVDLSEPMLRRCRRRIDALRLDYIEGLAAMDALRLAFADSTFDAAVAPFVLTVVPDPLRSLEELARVVRPGGEIILVNHFGAQAGVLAAIETWLAGRSAALGWRPTFPWSIVADWICSRRDIAIVERRALAPFGLFTLVRLSRGAVEG